MENKQPDYKDSMTQRKTLATGNQTTTQAFVSHGVVYISVSAMTVGRKSKEYILPASDIMYVYPLENYIGYSFNNPYSDLLLKFDNRRTPTKFKKYIKENYNAGNVYLKKLYDFENQRPYDAYNFIFAQNSAISVELESLGFKSWYGIYNQNDVLDNFRLVDDILTTMKTRLVDRAFKAGKLAKVSSGDEEKLDHISLSMANKNEIILYNRVGQALTMNAIMNKTVRAELKYFNNVNKK